MTAAALNNQIKDFYDVSTELWLNLWGDHMHHGLYPKGQNVRTHRDAQVLMIEALLDWAEITDVTHALDIGCGVGGSARYLASRYDATAAGITLSPVQVQHAQRLTRLAGLHERVRFDVGDALDMPFDDASADLVWALESAEHFPDRRQFMREAYRVLEPGGRLLMVTWVHREPAPPLTRAEHARLKKIQRAYALPNWVPMSRHVACAHDAGFGDIIADDWTAGVQPFWPAVLKSSLSVDAVLGLLRAGWTVIRGALTSFDMIMGFRQGVIRYGLLTATKPLETNA